MYTIFDNVHFNNSMLVTDNTTLKLGDENQQ